MKILKLASAGLFCAFLCNCITDKSESKSEPPPLTELYMVGSATPAGWNIQEPEPLARDSANPYLWNWEGILYSGELKFPIYKGTWSADYFMPLNPVEKDLNLTTVALVVNGTPDYKWTVTDSTMGIYHITLDTKTPSIKFTKLDTIPW